MRKFSWEGTVSWFGKSTGITVEWIWAGTGTGTAMGIVTRVSKGTGMKNPFLHTFSLILVWVERRGCEPILVLGSQPAGDTSSLSIESSIQYSGAHVSGSDHMAEVLELASLYSCQQAFLWLYFLQHWCVGPMCRRAYPQQSSICCSLETLYSSFVHSLQCPRFTPI